jgi:hypothetical protein
MRSLIHWGRLIVLLANALRRLRHAVDMPAHKAFPIMLPPRLFGRCNLSVPLLAV